jgi:DNA-binding LytR/AlgR family response regulator
MLHIALCDDENKICELYQSKLKAILDKEHIGAVVTSHCDSKQFLENLHHTAYDIVFLDIDMPGITGLQLAEKMMAFDKKPLLVFVTNQDALVYQSFQYHPFRFIRKSYFDDEIEGVLLNAIEEIRKKDNRFVFRHESETISLAVSEIMYFEASGNYLILHTKANTYRCRETMTKVENELSKKGFLRIHKGFLLNQEAVFRIGNDDVTLLDGKVLPIGRSNKEVVKQKLMRYLIR